MILINANLLIYAVDKDAPQHREARRWLESVLSGTETIGLPWIVTLAFLRLTTRADVFAAPLTPEQATGYIDGFLGQPCVRPVDAGANHWPVLRSLLRATGMAGNLTSDAHIAALAIEHGAAVYSADNDFKRFPGVEHVNPIG